MIAEMNKVTIAVPSHKKEALLQFLQEETVLHITQEDTQKEGSSSNTAHVLAQLQFTIDFIATVEKELGIVHKKSLKNMFAGKPTGNLEALEKAAEKIQVPELVARVERINDALTANATLTNELTTEIAALTPWKSLVYKKELSTAPVIHTLLSFTTADESAVLQAIQAIPTAAWQEVYRIPAKNSVTIFGELVAHTQDEAAVQAFETEYLATRANITLRDDASSIQDHFAALSEDLRTQARERKNILAQATELLPMRHDILFAHDAFLHKIERENAQQHVTTTPFTAMITGWIPTTWLAVFTQRLEKEFPFAALESTVVPREEKAPVMFQNNKFIRPFEVITDLYGKPAYNEVDPSGPLALFFLIGFGLALTDAGYGILMMIGTFLAERFLKLKRDMQKMVRVLFYAGAFTVVLGGVTGGWFSIALDKLPDSAIKHFLLGIKLIDPIKQPIVLLGLIFAFGIVQLVYAWVVRGMYHWQRGQKKIAIIDDFSWVAMVGSIIMWQVCAKVPALAQYLQASQYAMYAIGVFMIATQGRAAKNIFVKLGNGVMSLYGLIAFVSDMLSYSRLLALGLATGIIGLVVNLIASMVQSSIPVVGVVLAGVVLVVGHIFNLGINALGAYIHSGRLQFVEFFPKFLEGGGLPFRPFGRVGKYVDNPKDYVKAL